MRPTSMGFRSPKEQTGEFVIPQMNYVGLSMDFVKKGARNRELSDAEKRRYTTFSGQDRFYYKKVRSSSCLRN
jgi:hypothetical protein